MSFMMSCLKTEEREDVHEERFVCHCVKHYFLFR